MVIGLIQTFGNHVGTRAGPVLQGIARNFLPLANAASDPNIQTYAQRSPALIAALSDHIKGMLKIGAAITPFVSTAQAALTDPLAITPVITKENIVIDPTSYEPLTDFITSVLSCSHDGVREAISNFCDTCDNEAVIAAMEMTYGYLDPNREEGPNHHFAMLAAGRALKISLEGHPNAKNILESFEYLRLVISGEIPAMPSDSKETQLAKASPVAESAGHANIGQVNPQAYVPSGFGF